MAIELDLRQPMVRISSARTIYAAPALVTLLTMGHRCCLYKRCLATRILRRQHITLVPLSLITTRPLIMCAIKLPLSISSYSRLGYRNNTIAPLIATNMLHVAMKAVLIAVNRLYFPWLLSMIHLAIEPVATLETNRKIENF